jgi:hypothetical protein
MSGRGDADARSKAETRVAAIQCKAIYHYGHSFFYETITDILGTHAWMWLV